MRVISVLSGKGGVGKTTTVANIGIALSVLFNRKVVLLDGNSTTPDLGLHLGLYSFPYTLEDVLKRKVAIVEAIYHHPSGVDILPSSMSINTAGVDLRDLKGFFRDLEAYDFVFLDSPPGLGRGIRATLEVADEILVVTNPEVPAITDALRLIEVAKKVDVPVMGIVLNRVRGERYELSLPEVESVFDAPVIASIPEDARVRESIAFGEPIVSNSPFSPAAVAFKSLAARMIGEEYRVSFFDRLKALLGFGRRKPAPQIKIEIKPVEKPVAREAKEVKEVPVRAERPEWKPRVREVKAEKPQVEFRAEWSRYLAPPYRSKAPRELVAMGVEVIQGIDEGYRDKLAKAGYRTVGDLARASVDEVVRKAGLSAPLSDYFIAAAKAISNAAGE
jgi:septum site-determining protein MinD